MSSPDALSPSVSDLLAGPSSITTVGVSLFAEALADQAVATHQVDWRPPPVGTEEDLAAVLADPRRAEANRTAMERVLASGAVLVDVRPASEALGLAPGFRRRARGGRAVTSEQDKTRQRNFAQET